MCGDPVASRKPGGREALIVFCHKKMLACAPKHTDYIKKCVRAKAHLRQRALDELCFGETNLDKSSLGYALIAKCDAVIIIYCLYRRSAKFEEEPRNCIQHT